MAFQAFLVPYDLDVLRHGNGAGPEALVSNGHDIAAVGVTAYDPSYTAPATAAPIVNRLLRALLHTGP